MTLNRSCKPYEERNTEAHINDDGNTTNHNPDIVNGEGVQNVIGLVY